MASALFEPEAKCVVLTVDGTVTNGTIVGVNDVAVVVKRNDGVEYMFPWARIAYVRSA